MRRAVVVLLGVSLALAGCGPNAQEVRICEMYVDADGGMARSVADWLKSDKEFPVPDRAELVAASGMSSEQWAQQHAQHMAEFTQAQNARARSIVSARLAVSLREVDEALGRCLESSLTAKYMGKYGPRR